jgi:hypothetical protein
VIAQSVKNGAIPPFPQHAFMAWCSVKAQGQLYLYPYEGKTLHIFFNYKMFTNTGLLNNTLKPNTVQRSSRLKMFKTLAVLSLHYGSEIGTIKLYKNRLSAAQMKFYNEWQSTLIMTAKEIRKF